MKKRGMSEKAQVWVETVVYTLIGLTIIGIVVAIATPKINQMKDNAVVEQTMTAMNQLHEKIISIQTAVGNSRKADLRVKKGSFTIDSINDKLIFLIEGTDLKYSELNQEVAQGDLLIKTEEKNGNYDISLILNYQGKNNVMFQGTEEVKQLTKAPTPYQLLIKNNGAGVLDISLI